MFRDTAINVTIEGHKHLGAALGSRSFLDEYVGEKVDEWVNEVTKLADFASSLLCSLHFWSAAPLDIFPIRTLPDIAELLEPLERAITVRFSYQLSLTIQSLKQSATSLVSLCA